MDGLVERTGTEAADLDKLYNYQAGDEAREALKRAQVVVLAGTSGVGKDTIASSLAGYRGGYHVLISHTTRDPRVNNGNPEQDGVDYHFVGVNQMAQVARAGGLVEVKGYGGRFYGTSVAEVEDATAHHQAALAVIEVQGVEEYRALAPYLQVFFVVPPSYGAWQARLCGRSGGQMERADWRRRMEAARDELQHALSSDGFHFMINDSLEHAVDEVDGIVKGRIKSPQEAAHARRVARDILDRLDIELNGSRFRRARILGYNVLKALRAI